MAKVYIQPIQSENENDPNVRIRVKTSTLDEYTGEQKMNPKYLDKLMQWVKKQKYTYQSLNNDQELELKVEIFKFHLYKHAKNDVETLKQDIAAMRKQNTELKGQQKLFRYYFLNLWREK